MPNPGFDEFDNCPIDDINISNYVKEWYMVTPTPDYFNECGSTMGAPLNTLGYQACRSGSGYMGAHIFTANNYIGVPLESFQVKLKSELIAEKKYCVSFFVNPSSASGYYIDCFDAYFSKTASIYAGINIDTSHLSKVSNIQGHIVSDTLAWTEITGNFIAKGGEQYLTLGCLKTLIGIDTIKNSAPMPILPLDNSSYYFFEDISVFYCDETTLDDIAIPNIFSPNNDGVNDLFTFSIDSNLTKQNVNLVIYNRWGTEVYKTNDAVGQPWDGKTILGNRASTGIYYYVLHDGKNTKSGFVQVSY